MAYTITWLGQGGFLISIGSARVALDPYLSDSVYASSDGFKRLIPPPIAPDGLEVDLMIFSHDHLDHLDPETVAGSRAASYAGPDSCLRHLRDMGYGEDKLIALSRGDILRIGGARIMGVPANHTDDSIGVVIDYAGIKLYITADTLYGKNLKSIGAIGIDIMLTCMNGKLGNMNAIEAARLAKEIDCRVAIPMHYGMFAENTADPAEFIDELSGSGIFARTIEVGREISVLEIMEAAV